MADRSLDLSLLITAKDLASAKVNGLSKSIEKNKEALTTGAVAMIAFGTAIVGAGTFAVMQSAKFESLEASFSVLLSSTIKAKKHMQELTDFAASTPFQLSDLADASQLMQNFGFDIKNVMPSLQMLGDIAGSNKQRFQQLSLAYAQIQASGRLMGQDLLQLINAGFNPLKVMSEMTGKSMRELKDDMSRGAISAEMVTEAFKIATSEGGKFYKNMQTQSLTAGGLFSTLKDNYVLTAKVIGDIYLPKVKEVLAHFIKLTAGIRKFTNEHPIIMSMLTSVTLGVGALSLAVGSLTLATIALLPKLKVLYVFLAANPFILIGTAIAALVIGIVVLVKHWDDIIYSLDRSTKAGKFFVGVMVTIEAILGTILNVLKAAGTGFLALGQAITGNFQEAKKSFTSMVDQIATMPAKFEATYDEDKKNYQTHLQAKLDATKEASEETVETQKEAIDVMLLNEEEFNAQMISYAMANAEARKLTETTLQAEMKAIREKMKNDWIDAWAVMMLESKTKSKTFYDYYVDLINGMTSAMRTGFADVIGHIGEGWDNLKGYAQKMAEGIRDSFINMLADMATNWIKEHILMSNATKVWKFLEVSASAAVGAAKAAAATAWTLFGAIAIGAAVGAAILAFGNQFAQGGIVGGSSFGGDNVMARVNSGEMILNASQQARLFEMANGRRSGGGINVVIEFTGNNFVGSAGVEEVAELVSREIYNKVKNEVML